jgi:hypothetical protein
VLEPALSTEGPMGKVMLTVLGMVAEMSLASFASGSVLGSKQQRSAACTRTGPRPSIMVGLSCFASKEKGTRRSPESCAAARGAVYKVLAHVV